MDVVPAWVAAEGEVGAVTAAFFEAQSRVASIFVATFAGWLAAGPQRTRGEFALVLHACAPPESSGDSSRVLQLLLAELPLKTAVRLAADITGAARNELYETALKLKQA